MRNRYKIDGDTTIIYAKYKKQVFEVYISTTDLPRVLARSRGWRVTPQGKGTERYRVIGSIDGLAGEIINRVYLHRFLMNAPAGMDVDHIDNSPLNNRRDNLRVVPHWANQQNFAGANIKSKTGVRGVYWNEHHRKYHGFARCNGKTKYLGFFDTTAEAEVVVKAARAEFYPFSKEGMAVRQLEAAWCSSY